MEVIIKDVVKKVILYINVKNKVEFDKKQRNNLLYCYVCDTCVETDTFNDGCGMCWDCFKKFFEDNTAFGKYRLCMGYLRRQMTIYGINIGILSMSIILVQMICDPSPNCHMTLNWNSRFINI